MVKQVLFLSVLAIAQISSAAVCSSYSKKMAASNYDDILKFQNAGVATKTDALLAQKALIEAQLCDNAMDIEALAKLSTNIKERVKTIQNSYEYSSSTQEAVDAVKAELTSFLALCRSTYLPSAKKLEKFGEITPGQLDTLSDACTAE